MLRYRTESISIRNMTYLFFVIVISLINGVGPLTLNDLVIVNLIAISLVIFAETRLFATDKLIMKINYEKISNIQTDNRDELFKDLSERTGLVIHDVRVIDIDFLTDTANLEVCCSQKDQR